jgi:hypothetical protein
MTNVNVHNYDATSKEYIGSTPARMDPLDGTPLVPANATLIDPPNVVVTDQVACFIDKAWVMLDDNRGIIYNKITRLSQVLNQLGDIPVEFTPIEPPPRGIWDENSGVWIENLEEVKAAAIVEIKAQTSALIQGGVTSRALGTIHEYPTGITDQMNLTAVVLSGNAAMFWCKDEGGIWARRLHTAEQIAQVGEDVMGSVVTHQDNYGTALKAIEAATTIEEVHLISI